jgi:hypothetical protein
MNVRMHVCMHVCLHAFMYACTYVRVCVMYLCVYVHVHVNYFLLKRSRFNKKYDHVLLIARAALGLKVSIYLHMKVQRGSDR